MRVGGSTTGTVCTSHGLRQLEVLSSGPPAPGQERQGRPCSCGSAQRRGRGWGGIQARCKEGREPWAGEDSTFPGAHVSSTPFPLGVVTWSLWDVEKVGRDKGVFCKIFISFK